MWDQLRTFIWLVIENVPAFLTVAFAAYVLVQSQRATLTEMEVLLWLLGIVGLLATSELVERFRRLRRIETASLRTLDVVEALSVGDAEGILRDRGAAINLAKEASKAKKIWACGYSLINLVSAYEGFFQEQLKNKCDMRFLLLDPHSDAAQTLDSLVTTRSGELISDIKNALARLERVRTNAASTGTGQLEVRVLKVPPTCSLLLLDPDKPDGYVHVEPYPPYQGLPLDVGRPHLILIQTQGRWYQFYCDQFERMWNDPTYTDAHIPAPQPQKHISQLHNPHQQQVRPGMEGRMSAFGELLKAFRERSGLSQSALAEAANIDEGYISKLESGESQVASRSLALTLAKALGLAPDEVDRWLITAGYVSPRMQAMVERNGVSRLWEEFDPPSQGFGAESE